MQWHDDWSSPWDVMMRTMIANKAVEDVVGGKKGLWFVEDTWYKQQGCHQGMQQQQQWWQLRWYRTKGRRNKGPVVWIAQWHRQHGCHQGMHKQRDMMVMGHNTMGMAWWDATTITTIQMNFWNSRSNSKGLSLLNNDNQLKKQQINILSQQKKQSKTGSERYERVSRQKWWRILCEYWWQHEQRERKRTKWALESLWVLSQPINTCWNST